MRKVSVVRSAPGTLGRIEYGGVARGSVDARGCESEVCHDPAGGGGAGA
jgi:hypothetical protein